MRTTINRDNQRDRRLIPAAVGLSAAGDFLAVFPLAAIVASITGSGVAVAALFAALWAPSVIFSSLAGRLVDRVENTGLLRVVSSLQALAALAMLPFVDSVVGILAVATLLGTGHAIAQAAEFALIPAIADGQRLQKLNGSVETSRYIGMTAGPLAGGLIATLVGVEVALIIDALTFVFVALVATSLRARRKPGISDEDDQVKAGRARDGFVLLFGREPLRSAMVVAAIALVLMTTMWAAEPFFAEEVLGAGEFGYGALFSSWMLGMAVGAMTLAHRIPRSMLAIGAMIAIVVQGSGLLLPTIWLALPLACAFHAIGGVAHGVKNVLLRTLIQQEVPEARHGRAAAAYNALRNGAELIALGSGGLMVTTFGARTTLSLSGALPMVVALVALAVWVARASRQIRSPECVDVAAAPAR